MREDEDLETVIPLTLSARDYEAFCAAIDADEEPNEKLRALFADGND